MNYTAIASAMRAEIESPQRLYMPNSPGAYVRDRLFKECLWEEAAWAVEAERAKEQEALYAVDAPDRQGDQNGDDPKSE